MIAVAWSERVVPLESVDAMAVRDRTTRAIIFGEHLPGDVCKTLAPYLHAELGENGSDVAAVVVPRGRAVAMCEAVRELDGG